MVSSGFVELLVSSVLSAFGEVFRKVVEDVVPILGIVVCVVMMYGLGRHNWERLLIWMAVGLLVYFIYGIRNSLVRKQQGGL